MKSNDKSGHSAAFIVYISSPYLGRFYSLREPWLITMRPIPLAHLNKLQSIVL
jgi:hypothetical protein